MSCGSPEDLHLELLVLQLLRPMRLSWMVTPVATASTKKTRRTSHGANRVDEHRNLLPWVTSPCRMGDVLLFPQMLHGRMGVGSMAWDLKVSLVPVRHCRPTRPEAVTGMACTRSSGRRVLTWGTHGSTLPEGPRCNTRCNHLLMSLRWRGRRAPCTQHRRCFPCLCPTRATWPTTRTPRRAPLQEAPLHRADFHCIRRTPGCHRLIRRILGRTCC
mmetsp:Transcript_82491/g.237196  ORF Transcript_82491/g.237196 Transcript_82491/m.237196 type:complete len:216 (-) Transcript_82491:64-711(-)